MRNLGEAISSIITKEIAKLDFLDTAEIMEVHYTRGVDTDGNEYLPGTALIKIQDGSDTNQINNVPIVSSNASTLSGIIMFPRLKDIVVVAYLEQDKHAPIIIGSIFNTDSNELFDATENDWTIKHPSGSFIKFEEDGDIIISTPAGKRTKVI